MLDKKLTHWPVCSGKKLVYHHRRLCFSLSYTCLTEVCFMSSFAVFLRRALHPTWQSFCGYPGVPDASQTSLLFSQWRHRRWSVFQNNCCWFALCCGTLSPSSQLHIEVLLYEIEYVHGVFGLLSKKAPSLKVSVALSSVDHSCLGTDCKLLQADKCHYTFQISRLALTWMNALLSYTWFNDCTWEFPAVAVKLYPLDGAYIWSDTPKKYLADKILQTHLMEEGLGLSNFCDKSLQCCLVAAEGRMTTEDTWSYEHDN